MNNILTLQELINNSDNIVFYGGAGTSTESGIPDFKGKNGLYTQHTNKDYSPEYLLSIRCLYKEPSLFFDNFRKNLNCLDAEPNVLHFYLKHLEDVGKLQAIVTQNIDGLHQKAGSKKVYEIHGTINKCHCDKCYKEYPSSFVFETAEIPKCECGSMIRPNIVLYGEMLPKEYEIAQSYIYRADLLIVAGTSLTVQPACGLIKVFGGKHLVIINEVPTPFDDNAELVIHDSLGNVFSQLN